MYHTPHNLFDSAWPESVAVTVALLLILRLLLWRSPWAVVPWLSSALSAFLCTFGLGSILLMLFVFGGRGGSGNMFHPLAFAGPIVLALVIGLPLCAIVWLMRPAFDKLQRKHWKVAIIAIPAAILLFLNAPRIYNTQVVIECKRHDGTQPPPLTLQRMQENEVIPVGLPITSDAFGRFYITLNRRESFTAIISSPGYQPRKIGLFPHPKKGFWYCFRAGNELEQLPLRSPGTIAVTIIEASKAAL